MQLLEDTFGLINDEIRARNPERRRAGLEDLESLAEVAQQLSRLLSWRALRRVAST